MKYNYIAIEGTIGAGKTSLASKIAEDFGGKLILEKFEENSFLQKFYKNPDKYAFPLEMSFMASRFQQLKDDLSQTDLFSNFTIADYFLDKSLIFARETLQNDEFSLFSRFFNFINSGLTKPDLVMYLYVDVHQLKRNIVKRGRSYEQEIGEDYLGKIQRGYFNYFRMHKDLRVVIVDTNKIDFVDKLEDYHRIIQLLEDDYPKGITRLTMD